VKAARLVLTALLLAGCASGEQGRSTTPAAGFTIHADRGSTVYVLIHGDGNAKGTAAPENASSGQEVKGPDVKVDATVPLR
jgi:ABC-type glycerol-3-phosphate transport system substrate-binding protein